MTNTVRTGTVRTGAVGNEPASLRTIGPHVIPVKGEFANMSQKCHGKTADLTQRKTGLSRTQYKFYEDVFVLSSRFLCARLVLSPIHEFNAIFVAVFLARAFPQPPFRTAPVIALMRGFPMRMFRRNYEKSVLTLSLWTKKKQR
jgi:hypothetical protein